ncbi:MAG: hypothetical protein ABR497_08625 [Kiritimatiellia bacterium]|nr:hypothetical protein [Lentisphaerota bacterium]
MQDQQILFIGLGDAGGRSLTQLARDQPDHPRLILIDTMDRPSQLPECIDFLRIGAKELRAQGTGGDPRLGHKAMTEAMPGLRPLLQHVSMLVLFAGLGGGTGTGAAPVILSEARRQGILTLGIGSLPFDFEGPRRLKKAEHGFLAMQEAADGAICLPHQRLVTGLPPEGLNAAKIFRQADQLVAQCLQSLWQVLTRRGVINVAFNDLCTLMRSGSGRCLMVCAETAAADKKTAAIKLMRHPLLEDGAIWRAAHGCLLNITGGEDLTLHDIRAIVEELGSQLPMERLMMTGVICDGQLAQRTRLVLFVAEGSAITKASPASPGASDQKTISKMVQPGLFDDAGRGRFKDVSPTVIHGSNLDIPAFIRRGIPIQKVRDASS